jgi:hypothetical protein
MNFAVPPSGGIPAGKAKSFDEPTSMNMNAATMRSTLRSCGAHVDTFEASFGMVTMFLLRSVGL